MLARVAPLTTDLRRVFGSRLESLVAYGNLDEDEVRTLALVEALTFQDLAACVPLAGAWRKAGLAVPLLLSRAEFVRTLDVFPLEYGDIIARHLVVLGADPFVGVRVSDADIRRACEMQVKSHLIHLREGYLEGGAEPRAIATLIAASAASLQAVVANLERLDPGVAERAGVTPALTSEVAAAAASTIADPSALLTRYLTAVERLWQSVDGWRS